MSDRAECESYTIQNMYTSGKNMLTIITRERETTRGGIDEDADKQERMKQM